jgi:hypothetical protein
MISMTVAWSRELICSSFPRAAVPVTVKIPDPITAPIPRNVRLHGPSVFFSRWLGSSEDAMSSSMFFVRKKDMVATAKGPVAGGQWPAKV